MGGKAPANKAAMIQGLGRRRGNQGLGQKPVVSAENTQNRDLRGLSPAQGASTTPSFTSGPGASASEGICLTSRTAPKGLARLLQESWRSCSAPKLL